MKKIFVLLLVILSLSGSAFVVAQTKQEKREYYQVSIYHFKTDSQKLKIDQYLEKALLPALHRRQIKNIGVFSPIANDTVMDKKIVVIMPAASVGQITALPDNLANDQTYQTDAKDFIGATY